MHRLKFSITAFVTTAALIFVSPVLGAVRSGRLVLPSQTLDRTGEVPVVFQLERGFTGRATLHIHWTDSLGRGVEDETLPYDLLDETSVTFHINLARAVAMENNLSVDVSLEGKGINGAPIRKQETAEADFIARPDAGWNDLQLSS